LTIGELAFYVEVNVSVAKGDSTVTVQLIAAERGTAFNGQTGTIQLVDSISWVSEVTIIGESGNGINQEEDEEYINRLAALLTLQAPRPVNAADFAPFVLNESSQTLSGIIVGRATAIDLYDAETSEENVANCCTTWVTNVNGEALTTLEMETLQTFVRSYLAQNFLAFIRAPVFETIFVTTHVHIRANYTPEGVVANIKTALAELLSPKFWGNPERLTTGANAWINETKVRYNTILGAIEAVRGVAYVFPEAEGLKIGASATPTETKDITLGGGPVVLPRTTSESIVVTYA